jgi:hypothetical protein
MSSDSPLGKWRFLIGEWKGETANQFGEKGVVESTVTFSFEPSEKFIMAKGESWCEGRLLNRAISLLFYDKAKDKFRRKSFFSYGFVNNEVECNRDSNEITFDVEVEPVPKEFEGIRWRSYLKKISETQIAMGLEMAKVGEEFKTYGETVYLKQTKPMKTR